jgi:hypothetical protein
MVMEQKMAEININANDIEKHDGDHFRYQSSNNWLDYIPWGPVIMLAVMAAYMLYHILFK